MKKQERSKWTVLTRQGLAMLLVAVMLVGYLLPGGVNAVDDLTDPTVETTAPEETTGETKATEPEGTTAPTEPEETTAPAETQPEETTAPSEPEETGPEQTPYEKVMADLAALEEEAKALEATLEVLDDFYARALNVYGIAFDLYDVDKLTEDEWNAVDAKFQSIVVYLKDTYGYENGQITSMAVPTGTLNKDNMKVSGVAENVEIHLFNYNTQIDNYSKAVLRFKAQVSSNLYGKDAFLEDGTDNQYSDVANNQDGGNYVGTPTMHLNLGTDQFPNVKKVDSQPTTTDTTKIIDSGSLAYLFDPDMTNVTGRTYHPVSNDGSGTGLFQKNAAGYYYYDSADNHAEYVNGKFQLYSFALRPFGGRAQNRGQGHFLPFNTDVSEAVQLTDASRKWVVTNTTNPTAEEKAYWQRVNLWDSTNNKFAYDDSSNNARMGKNVWVLDNDKPKVGSADFETQVAQLPDYWFGMSVEFNFNITAVNDEGRPVIVDENGNEQDMIFSFLGDDDVFVYIDDVLILDLGGGSCDYGEINFTQGTSTETSGADNTTEVINIAEIFNSAIKEANANATANYNYDNEFKQYTTHNLKFYYLERGSGTANCELKFNMEPMPAGAVNVTKALTEDSVTTAYTENDVYTFQLLEKVDNEYKPVTKATYQIGNGNATNIGSDGTFTVKAGQTASFNDLEPDTDGRMFKVVELTDSEHLINAEYVDVEYAGSENGQTVSNVYAEFTILPTDKDNKITHNIVFTNQLKTTDVTVTKNVTGNMGDRSKEFTFTAELYQADATTPISFPVPGSRIDYTVDGNKATFKLKHGETGINFDRIPLGATVVITETDYSGLEYTTAYKVNGGTATEGRTATLASVTTSQSVEFTNDKEVTIDTGIALDSMPYIVLLVGVAAIGLILFAPKRKTGE